MKIKYIYKIILENKEKNNSTKIIQKLKTNTKYKKHIRRRRNMNKILPWEHFESLYKVLYPFHQTKNELTVHFFLEIPLNNTLIAYLFISCFYRNWSVRTVTIVPVVAHTAVWAPDRLAHPIRSKWCVLHLHQQAHRVRDPCHQQWVSKWLKISSSTLFSLIVMCSTKPPNFTPLK